MGGDMRKFRKMISDSVVLGGWMMIGLGIRFRNKDFIDLVSYL